MLRPLDLNSTYYNSTECPLRTCKYKTGHALLILLSPIYYHFVSSLLTIMRSLLQFKQSNEKSPMTQESSRPIEVPLTVVELFQSQGCSSCPPSNSNVLRLIDDPNILVLTYNVTYWDRLGWKDTFGKSSFDQRQWEYARKMQRKNVFTPQVSR